MMPEMTRAFENNFDVIILTFLLKSNTSGRSDQNYGIVVVVIILCKNIKHALSYEVGDI